MDITGKVGKLEASAQGMMGMSNIELINLVGYSVINRNTNSAFHYSSGTAVGSETQNHSILFEGHLAQE